MNSPQSSSNDTLSSIALPSGLAVRSAEGRLLRFCREEYAYYDAIECSSPNHITPVDVLATVSVNSFINNATAVRSIHRELASRCDHLLSKIPVDASLGSSESVIADFERLLHAAVQAPNVLVPKATKVLHRKRRSLVPMLDNVVLEFYLDAFGETQRKSQTQNKRSAATVATDVLRRFRDDLVAAERPVLQLQSKLKAAGYSLSAVRILEILVWTEVEQRGYYR